MRFEGRCISDFVYRLAEIQEAIIFQMATKKSAV